MGWSWQDFLSALVVNAGLGLLFLAAFLVLRLLPIYRDYYHARLMKESNHGP